MKLPMWANIVIVVGFFVLVAVVWGALALTNKNSGETRGARMQAFAEERYGLLVRERGFSLTQAEDRCELRGEQGGHRVQIEVREETHRGVRTIRTLRVAGLASFPLKEGLRWEREALDDLSVATLRAAARRPDRVTRQDTAPLDDAALQAIGGTLERLGGVLVLQPGELRWLTQSDTPTASGVAEVEALVELTQVLEGSP